MAETAGAEVGQEGGALAQLCVGSAVLEQQVGLWVSAEGHQQTWVWGTLHLTFIATQNS